MIFIANSFSLNMLPASLVTGLSPFQLTVEPTQVCEVKHLLDRSLFHSGFTSAVGHADTAAVYSDLLGMAIPENRVSIVLEESDTLIVGQLTGARLPEGCKELPVGAEINWVVITLGLNGCNW
jgi:hypothetical protein